MLAKEMPHSARRIWLTAASWLVAFLLVTALRKTPISSCGHSTSGLLDNRSSTALREKNFDGPMWLLALAASMSRITLSSRCCLPLPVGAIPTA